MRKQQKIKKGISLIILIVTVIIMIILGTSVILLVSERTIIKNANRALKESDISKAKEIVIVAKTDWRTNERQVLKEGYTTFKEYAESRLEQVGFSIGKNAGQFEVSYDGFLYEYKKPYVPNGFIASDLDDEDELSEGFVIYEGNERVSKDQDAKTTRNQFIWIPVPNINQLVTKDGYESGNLQNHVSLGEVSEPCSTAIISFKELSEKTGEYAEYEKVIDSIEKYGGFYVGRYEAGTTNKRENISNNTSFNNNNTPDLIIQKDKPVYNYVGWGNSIMEIDSDVITENNLNQGYGAVNLARSMYKNNMAEGDPISHLIYGVQWDSIIRYIEGAIDVTDSSEYGNYSNYNQKAEETKKVTGAGSIQYTGFSEKWKIKNIYDIAGNVSEWTMEAFHGPFNGRILRGGSYINNGYESPVSTRLEGYTNTCNENYGFRVALYIK